MNFHKSIAVRTIFLSFILFFLNNFYCLTKEPIILKNADSLIGSQTAESGIRMFIGNVLFQHKDVFLSCDSAIHYLSLNRAELKGNVVITQNEILIKSNYILYDGNENLIFSPKGVFLADSKQQMLADTGYYYTNTNIAEFLGNVIIIEKKPKLRCNYALYNRETGFGLARGNVKYEDDTAIIYCDLLKNFEKENFLVAKSNIYLISKSNQIVLSCDSLIYYRNDNHLRAFINPIIFQIDSTEIQDTIENKNHNNEKKDISAVIKKYKYDTLTISAEYMSFFSKNNQERYIFENKVEIVRNNVYSISNYAFYNRSENYINLIGNSILWYDSTQVHSDTINVYLDNNKLQKIECFGNSIALSRDDTTNIKKINQLSGKSIIIEFVNDSITSIKALEDAKSLYFVISEEKGEGLSRNFSDTIIVHFSNNQAERIDWLGVVFGEFFPETFVETKIEEYYLPNFKWSDNRPRKKELKLNFPY